ncbi:MAG: SPFH domain-containing protein [Candidatus Gastranaerophilaceae bacterium]
MRFEFENEIEAKPNKKPINLKKYIILGVIALITIVVFLCSYTIVPTGYTGVRTTLGQISEQVCSNGWNWKIPFVQTINKVNNKQQDIVISDEVWSETDKRTAVCYKDITVTYQISPEKSAWIYANVSNYKDCLITTDLVSSGLKSASKTLSDEDSTNRSIIEPKAKEEIQRVFNEKYGENTVLINRVTINSADFEEAYNQAIADKQNAQIAAEKQAIDNQKAIDQATAEAEAKKIAAQGEADAKEILNQTISEKTLQEKWLDKWNGQLPQYVGGDNSSVMFGFGATE